MRRTGHTLCATAALAAALACGEPADDTTDGMTDTPQDTVDDSDTDTDTERPLDTDLPAGTDADNDGFAVPDDCDDSDPAIFPGALEQIDGEDNDCDGLVDTQELGSRYLLLDGGYHLRDTVGADLSLSGWTLTFWVRLDELAPEGNELVSIIGTAQSNLLLRLTDDARVRANVTGNIGAEATGSSTVALPYNAWTYVAASFDRNAQKLRFYIDGAPAGDPPLTTAFWGQGFNLPGPMQLGGLSVTEGTVFDVDDVRWYSGSLTGEQIRATALAPAPNKGLLMSLNFEASTLDAADVAPAPSTGGDSRRFEHAYHPWAPKP